MNDSLREKSSPSKTLLISGIRGCIGQALCPLLQNNGYVVTGLSRSSSRGMLHWQPQQGELNLDFLDEGQLYGVIHLSGENIAQRWTSKARERILQSREQVTRLLCQRLAAMKTPPKVLISASAIGIYPRITDREIDETGEYGTGFLAEVVQKWEAATQAAQEAGIRVIHLRIGLVLTPQGGILQKLLLPFKLGLGAQLGNGQQHHSWIAMDDLVAIIHFCLKKETLYGPINAVAPTSITHSEFVRTLAKTLHRPAFLRMPQWVIQTIFGNMGKETILASQQITPQKLIQANYTFLYPYLRPALTHIIRQNK